MKMPTANANSPKVEKPVLLEAINFTFRTIEQRARQYRNLVVAVSLTGAGSIILALILRRWMLLGGELALPLYFAVFVYFDNRVVAKWQRGILKMRDEQELNIAQLAQTLTGLRNLPQATLRMMLGKLTSEKPTL